MVTIIVLAACLGTHVQYRERMFSKPCLQDMVLSRVHELTLNRVLAQTAQCNSTHTK